MSDTQASATPPSSPHAPRRRVVVTGLGVINPIGLTLETFWQSLAERKSGVKRIELFDASRLPTQIAGEIPQFDAKQYVEKKDRKSLRVMARTIELAVAAAQQAIVDCGVSKEQLEPTRFGVEFGAGLMATELPELAAAAQVSANCQPGVVDLEKWGEEGIPTIPPLWMLKYLPNMLACHVSILHNAQGPNNTITEGDVAGLLAIGEAYRILQRDQADFFLAGGADSKLNPLSMVRQCLFSTLSRRNDAPQKASRPFDRSRDGLVVGEGGAVVALEEIGHARRRGAKIYAELVGFGVAFDLRRNGAGIARAVRAALQEAGITPAQIDHVNAHGLSTPHVDIWEARGLRAALGDLWQQTPVFAAKSYFGNLGAGSGPSELAASLLALSRGSVPATLNYEEPDPECPLAVTQSERPLERPYVLKVGFTDMGQCAALVFKKWEPAS